MRHLLLSLCYLAPLAAAVNGHRGPENLGAFPARDIVTSCDEGKGQNVVWKAALPFIGCNSPVYAAGKVFVVCDGGWKSDAPQLLCFDVHTGKELWRQVVDNLDARPEAEAKWARAERAKELAMARKSRELKYQYDRADDSESKQAIVDEGLKAGFAFQLEKKAKGKGRFSLCSTKMVFTPAHTKPNDYKRLKSEGLFEWEGWYYPSRIFTGATFPSVVSDGQFVWVYTNNNALGSFDLEGKRTWIVDLRMPVGKEHGSGPITTASPTLVGDAIIVTCHDCTIALDRATGEERWRHTPKAKGAYQAASAAIPLTVANAEYVYISSGELLRVDSGSVAGTLVHPADLAGEKRTHGLYFGAHAQSLARGRWLWVIHLGYGGGAKRAKPGLFAYELTADEGGRLTGNLKWQFGDARNHARAIALDGDKLYAWVGKGFRIFEAQTGAEVAKVDGVSGNHNCSSTFCVTEDAVIFNVHSNQHHLRPKPGYRGTGTLRFLDKTTLKMKGEGSLLMDVGEGEVLQKRIARVAADWWPWGASSPTAWGNRVFIRSHDAVYCIGDPKVPFRE